MLLLVQRPITVTIPIQPFCTHSAPGIRLQEKLAIAMGLTENKLSDAMQTAASVWNGIHDNCQLQLDCQRQQLSKHWISPVPFRQQFHLTATGNSTKLCHDMPCCGPWGQFPDPGQRQRLCPHRHPRRLDGDCWCQLFCSYFQFCLG